MNSIIESANQLGENLPGFVWPMLWQSSALIAVLFALELLLRSKIRASIRYALWLVLLVKLCVPPTFALPTSPAWWLHQQPIVVAKPKLPHYTVTYDQAPITQLSLTPLPDNSPPTLVLTKSAWLLVLFVFTSAFLLVWMLARWWQITRIVWRSAASERLTALADEARQRIGMKANASVKLTPKAMSPAVCGLFRPVIMVPQSLAAAFADEQLRAVLLHELIHLRRRDVWLNFLQTLLQIVYWWHPLIWLANARIRRVREEAVDDEVMLALCDEAETYAPTLLEVAKLALNRPLATLGLVGILELRSALRQRIERLVDFRPPRKAGLTLVSLLGILAFTAVAVPMGEGPSLTEEQSEPNATVSESQPQLALTFKMTRPESEGFLESQLFEAGVKIPPTIIHEFNNGILFARGTVEQLSLINQIIFKLNGCSSQKVAAATNIPDYAIKIPVDEPAAAQFYSRTFKINQEVISANLLNQTEVQPNEINSDVVSEALRKLFIELGLNLESPKGKVIDYNGKLGKLFTKTTSSDIAVIECVIEALGIAPPPKTNVNLPSRARVTNVVGIVGALSDANTRPTISNLQPASDIIGPAVGPDGVDTAKLLAEENIEKTTPPTVKSAVAIAQLHTRARFFEVPESFFDDASRTFLTGRIPHWFPTGVTNGIGILTSSEAKEFLAEIESQQGSNNTRLSKLTWFSTFSSVGL